MRAVQIKSAQNTGPEAVIHHRAIQTIIITKTCRQMLFRAARCLEAIHKTRTMPN